MGPRVLVNSQPVVTRVKATRLSLPGDLYKQCWRMCINNVGDVKGNVSWKRASETIQSIGLK